MGCGYHVVGFGGKAKNVAQAIHMIVKGDCDKTNEIGKEDVKVFLIPGNRQAHHLHKNVNKLNSDEYVGKGVYCSPNPKVMDSYGQEYQGYKMSLMLRVKPQRIRYCDCVCEKEKSSAEGGQKGYRAADNFGRAYRVQLDIPV